MRMRKMNRTSRILLCLGLIMSSGLTLARDYVTIPDYLRGIIAGTGIGLMIWAAVLQRKYDRKAGVGAESCSGRRRPFIFWRK